MKPIHKLEITDINKLRKCHIYEVNIVSDVQVRFADIELMREKLQELFQGRINQAFVERMLILYLAFGKDVCPA